MGTILRPLSNRIVWATLLCLSVGVSAPRTASGASEPPEAPRARVVVLGVDGVSLNLLKPYIERGVTPTLGRLIQRGTAGPLASFWPLRTPQVWTSAVTGKYPGQHGIWDHLSNTYFNPPPFRTRKKRRVTSEDRKSSALWSILDAKGMKTLTVGWVASWPAEALQHGVMIAPVELMGDRRQTSIKPSFYRGTTQTITPKTWSRELESLYRAPSTVSREDLLEFAALPPSGSPLYKLPRLKRYTYALRWSLARAESVERLTVAAFKKQPAEVVLSYFQCTDSLLHRFWIFQESEAAIAERFKEHKLPLGDIPELKRRFGRVVEQCYRDIDQRIKRILDAVAGPETLVMVLSDHGFGPASVPHRMPSEPYGGTHRDDGVLILAGPGIVPTKGVANASILDITPTLLTFLGQPVGEDMPGRTLRELFAPGALPPPGVISSYESTPQTAIPFRDGWPPRKAQTRAAVNKAERQPY